MHAPSLCRNLRTPWESVLSVYHVHERDQTQAISLGGQQLEWAVLGLSLIRMTSQAEMRHGTDRETRESVVPGLLRQGWVGMMALGTSVAPLSLGREPALEVKLGTWKKARRRHLQVPEGHV